MRLDLPPLCPLCGWATTRASRPKSSHPDAAYWRCSGCGAGHLHPAPSPEFLDDYYAGFHDANGPFGEFEKRAAADFPAKVRLVAQRLPPHASVLDVGCGKGLFVHELLAGGFQAEGIDVSAPAVTAGTAAGLPGLRCGRLEEMAEWHGRFDAVTAWATLEHVAHPKEFLRAIHHVLKPGGWLFLDTGLAADAVDRWAPGLIQWYDAPQHLFVFSRESMERLTDQSGFELVRLDAHFERTLPRRITKYLRNRFLAGAGRAFFRSLLGAAAFARMRLESRMPFGSLMFVICRRGGGA